MMLKISANKLQCLLLSIILFVFVVGESFFLYPRQLKVVSLAPNLTQIVMALGKESLLVGISGAVKFPQLQNITEVGGLEVDIEKLYSLEPDLILALKGFHDKIPALSNFKTYYFSFYSIEDIKEATKRIGEILKVSPSKIKEIIANYFSFKPLFKKRKKCLLIFWDRPFMTVGKSSYLNYFLWQLGLENIFSDIKNSYISVDEEEIVKRNPEIILIASKKKIDRFKSPIFSAVAAIKNRKVFFINPDFILRPGPSLKDAYLDLKQKVH